MNSPSAVGSNSITTNLTGLSRTLEKRIRQTLVLMRIAPEVGHAGQHKMFEIVYIELIFQAGIIQISLNK